MNTDTLQNHYLIVEGIEMAMRQPKSYPGLARLYEQQGMTCKWDLSQTILEEFEQQYRGCDWIETDYIDTIDNFVKQKLAEL